MVENRKLSHQCYSTGNNSSPEIVLPSPKKPFRGLRIPAFWSNTIGISVVILTSHCYDTSLSFPYPSHPKNKNKNKKNKTQTKKQQTKNHLGQTSETIFLPLFRSSWAPFSPRWVHDCMERSVTPAPHYPQGAVSSARSQRASPDLPSRGIAHVPSCLWL